MDNMHAAVIEAIRCGFAIGPRKSIGAPILADNVRIYAVNTANVPAIHPIIAA